MLLRLCGSVTYARMCAACCLLVYCLCPAVHGCAVSALCICLRVFEKGHLKSFGSFADAQGFTVATSNSTRPAGSSTTGLVTTDAGEKALRALPFDRVLDGAQARSSISESGIGEHRMLSNAYFEHHCLCTAAAQGLLQPLVHSRSTLHINLTMASSRL